MSARALLRAETAADHERVDALFSRFDLATREGYADFLAVQAGPFLSVEAALDESAAAKLISDWPARRRGALLLADLTSLGRLVPAPQEKCRLDGNPSLLGAIYVLEGSRLGGALLKRRVPDGLPRRFLEAAQPPGAWRSLMILLDKYLERPEEARAAVEAARGVFKRFEAAASAQLRTRPE